MFRKKGGFSLVQVLVAMGLLSGVMVAAFKILQQQVKVGRNSSEDFEAVYFIDRLNTFFANSNNCSATLAGKFALEDGIEVIYESVAGKKIEKYKVGSTKGLEGLGFIIDDIAIDGNDEEFSPQLSHTLLKIKLRSLENHTKIFEKTIPLHIVQGGSSEIESCYSLGGLDQLVLGSYESPWEENSQNSVTASGKKILFKSDGKVTQQDISVEKDFRALKRGNIPCVQSYKGVSFAYNMLNKKLQVCNSGKLLEVDVKDNSKMESKSFRFVSRSQGIKSYKIPNFWKYCFLDEIRTDGGSCSTRSINTAAKELKWEGLLKKTRGVEVECVFRCIK